MDTLDSGILLESNITAGTASGNKQRCYIGFENGSIAFLKINTSFQLNSSISLETCIKTNHKEVRI